MGSACQTQVSSEDQEHYVKIDLSSDPLQRFEHSLPFKGVQLTDFYSLTRSLLHDKGVPYAQLQATLTERGWQQCYKPLVKELGSRDSLTSTILLSKEFNVGENAISFHLLNCFALLHCESSVQERGVIFASMV